MGLNDLRDKLFAPILKRKEHLDRAISVSSNFESCWRKFSRRKGDEKCKAKMFHEAGRQDVINELSPILMELRGFLRFHYDTCPLMGRETEDRGCNCGLDPVMDKFLDAMETLDPYVWVP